MLNEMILAVGITLSAGGTTSGSIDIATDPNGVMKYKQVWNMVLQDRGTLDGPPWKYTFTCTDTVNKCVILMPAKATAK